MAKNKYEYWLTDDGLTLLEAWARDGLTDEQIADNCSINVKTLYDWKNKYGKICNALKKGKEIADIHVENALYKRAMGYEYEEETQIDYEGELITQKIIKKHMPPDVTAIIFWLKNRKGVDWRDKRDNDLKISTDSIVKIIDNIPDHDRNST